MTYYNFAHASMTEISMED